MPKFEPFDIICILLTASSVIMMMIGAVYSHADLFENARYIIISVTSAYVGKRWNSDKAKDESSNDKK